jgi:hypothetical protein
MRKWTQDLHPTRVDFDISGLRVKRMPQVFDTQNYDSKRQCSVFRAEVCAQTGAPTQPFRACAAIGCFGECLPVCDLAFVAKAAQFFRLTLIVRRPRRINAISSVEGYRILRFAGVGTEE